MVILALETATRRGSLALWIDGVVAAFAGETDRTHGERLPNEITTWLAGHGHTLADVDYFAVVSGPGSFTGLRVGVATIQGLALAGSKQVIAIPTLDAIASGWLDASPASARFAGYGAAEITVPCLDGHRGDVFFAAYETAPGSAFAASRVAIAPKVARSEDAADEIAALASGRAVTIVGDSAARHAAVWTERLPDARVIALPITIAAAAVRLAAGWTDRAASPHALRPVYLRRPDAEIARARAAASAVAALPPALSGVEGPALSGVEGPALSGVEGPALSRVEGPPPAFSIALAGADDLAGVEALQQRSFTNAWGAESIRWELENTDVARLYVVRAAGELVAYCACWMIFDELHINSLAVDLPWRRQGVARALLRRVMRDAVAAGGRGATLEVRRSNEPARALYEGLGFHVEAVRRDYYHEPREDALVLWHRRLAEASEAPATPD